MSTPRDAMGWSARDWELQPWGPSFEPPPDRSPERLWLRVERTPGAAPTVAESVADVLSYARGTGQTTMLCEAALAFDRIGPQRCACVVTWSAKEAAQLARQFHVSATGYHHRERFLGRRDTVYLVDNHVMQELGREAQGLRTEVERLAVEKNRLIAMVHSVGRHNTEQRAEIDYLRLVLRDLQVTRSRRATRRRKRSGGK